MPKLVIIYDSRTASTLIMSEAIEEGAKSVAGVEVERKSVKRARPEDLEQADGIILGSPTHADSKATQLMVEFLRGAGTIPLEGKLGAAFGSYTWNDEAVGFLTEKMKAYGMKVIEPGVAVKVALSGEGMELSERDLERCRELGELLARKITSHK